MELIVIITLLTLFGLLANRHGHDSRDRLRSPEECLAASGFTWEDQACADRTAHPLPSMAASAVRPRDRARAPAAMIADPRTDGLSASIAAGGEGGIA
jgi:hypothetical protein